MFGLAPTYLFVLRQRLPIGPTRSDRLTWISTMGTNFSIAVVISTLVWLVGIRAISSSASANSAYRRLGGSLAVLRAASVRGDILGAWPGMEFS